MSYAKFFEKRLNEPRPSHRYSVGALVEEERDPDVFLNELFSP